MSEERDDAGEEWSSAAVGGQICYIVFLLQDTITSGVRKLLNSVSPVLQSSSFFPSLCGVEKIDSFVKSEGERDGNQKKDRDSKDEVVGPGREIILFPVSIPLPGSRS